MNTIVKYQCRTCQDKPNFDDPKKMFAHLRDVHHIKGNPIHGTQIAHAFLDGRGWAAQSFIMIFEKVEIMKMVTVERGIQS